MNDEPSKEEIKDMIYSGVKDAFYIPYLETNLINAMSNCIDSPTKEEILATIKEGIKEVVTQDIKKLLNERTKNE